MWCIKHPLFRKEVNLLERYNVRGELEASFGLCEARHPYPVDDCIFPENIPIFAFGMQEITAKTVIEPLVKRGLTRLVIYTSGCTQALLSAINVAQKYKVREIVVMHYDSIKNDYQPQSIVTTNDVMW